LPAVVSAFGLSSDHLREFFHLGDIVEVGSVSKFCVETKRDLLDHFIDTINELLPSGFAIERVPERLGQPSYEAMTEEVTESGERGLLWIVTKMRDLRGTVLARPGAQRQDDIGGCIFWPYSGGFRVRYFDGVVVDEATVLEGAPQRGESDGRKQAAEDERMIYWSVCG